VAFLFYKTENETQVGFMSPVETVLLFLDCINQRDVDKLAELMTEDHVFIDSLGQSVQGREKMRAGWRSYYALCPDYWVSHEEIFRNEDLVAVFGSAGGTIAANGKLPPENQWRTSAAWLALVEKGLVKQWRVYADNKPVYDIMAKSQAHR
jgi:ketosteroid isomerase-like protein